MSARGVDPREPDATPVRVVQLAPARASVALDEVLALDAGPGEPFSAARRETLAQLSRRILHDAELRQDPPSTALGYWLRRAQMDRLAADFQRRCDATPDTVFVPAGRVFHVAPGNVDTVFVYSWALSFLCGNQNVVRVSQMGSAVLARLIQVIAELMEADPELVGGNRFVTYEHDAATNEALSLWSTHRVIWGGDETVRSMRSLPLSPHASERAFASKFSYCIVEAGAYGAADAETAEKLASGFFNDVFWFDQMACSSPHLVFWVGSAEQVDAAIDRFHAALAQEIERRRYRGAASSAMHRLNFAFDLACEADLRTELGHREFLPIRLAEGSAVRKEICGAGLFSHVRLDRLADLAGWVQARDQTVTHFGFAEGELRELAAWAGALGVDRFVPIGEALAFDARWDGFDLVGDFLRQVTVRAGARGSGYA